MSPIESLFTLGLGIVCGILIMVIAPKLKREVHRQSTLEEFDGRAWTYSGYNKVTKRKTANDPISTAADDY